MTVVLYLVIFAAGASVGVLVSGFLFVYDTYPQRDHYSTGYASGHSDGAIGIWRGGPLR